MKWIVLEEDFHQDNYIAIIAANSERKLKVENRKCRIFHSIDNAMSYARKLREQYKASAIRIFQPEA
jgi:hypothetical protein